MKTLLILLFCIGVLPSQGAGSPSGKSSENSGPEKLNLQQDLPRYSFGSKSRESLFQKKPKFILLDFWASWCEPCKESLPFYLHELQKKNLSDWALVAINVDSTKKEAEDFLKSVPLSTWILWDDEKKLSKQLNINAIPALFLLNSEGKILEVERGFTSQSKEKFKELIQKYQKN